MTTFEIGEAVRITGDTWFDGSVGIVEQVFPESGTYMVKLMRWRENDDVSVHIWQPITLPFAPSELTKKENA